MKAKINTEDKKFGRTFSAVLVSTALSAGVFLAGFTAASGMEQTVGAAGLTEPGNYNYTLTSSTAADASPVLSSYSDVYKAVKNSVVSISTLSFAQIPEAVSFYGYRFPGGGGIQGNNDVTPKQREIKGAASGVIFYEDEESIYIVTNFHVVDGAAGCTVSLDDETEVPASYVGGDAYSDLAVLSVKKSDLDAAGITDYSIVVFGDSDELEIADQVMAVGNALGEGKSAALGIVSAKNKSVTVDNRTLKLIQTDAAINRGNSGGALVNMHGEVVGINTLKLSSAIIEGIGYAIPSNAILSVIDEIMETGTVSRPYMGIEGVAADDEMAEEYGLTASGIYINRVLPGYTADKAGVRAGDIITGINGTVITEWEQFKSIIEDTEIGAEIVIEVTRNTYRQAGFGGRVTTGSETITLTGHMQNYTTDPSF